MDESSYHFSLKDRKIDLYFKFICLKEKTDKTLINA